ncbi:MAG: carboxynorspermidine decarboxylase [Cytophagales bacterium]|nr:MAG: carboxynorspermidine decarboxylase [Cytophagales bacterium]
MSKIPFETIPSPCFLLDEKLLRKNLELIQSIAQKSGAKIILALKGFSMYSSFGLVKHYVPGTTASSLNEARLGALEFGGEVHAYNVAYLDKEFEEMMQHCGHITFNSIAQWNKFKGKISQNTKKISCAIRINPEYSEVETDLYNPCIPGSRLGVTIQHFDKNLPEGIEGLHMHNLCEKDSYALERTWLEIEKNFSHLLTQISWFNMGGGHLMTKKGYDHNHLIEFIQSVYKKYPNIKEIILEPGSAFGWQTGYLVSKVLDVVESGGKEVAILDCSVSAHMPDCIEMPYTAKITDAESNNKGENVYLMGGLTCLAGDYMGPYSFKKPLKEGDIIVFEDMMHYTMVKTTTFNGVNLPNIGIWKENNTFELIKSFGYEEYKARL